MYKTLADYVGGTPLVRLTRLPGAEIEARGNVILAKLEGNNPAGSVKDRPALSMIRRAELRGVGQIEHGFQCAGRAVQGQGLRLGIHFAT